MVQPHFGGTMYKNFCITFVSGDSHTFALVEYCHDHTACEVILPDGQHKLFPWVQVREIAFHDLHESKG